MQRHNFVKSELCKSLSGMLEFGRDVSQQFIEPCSNFTALCANRATDRRGRDVQHFFRDQCKLNCFRMMYVWIIRVFVWFGIGPSPLIKLSGIRYSNKFTVKSGDVYETRSWLAATLVPPFQLF